MTTLFFIVLANLLSRVLAVGLAAVLSFRIFSRCGYLVAAVAAGLLLTVLLFGGGWLRSGAAPDVSRSVPGADPGQTGENAGQPAADANTVLRVWDGEQVVEMTMAEYLPGVVRGEMPAAFHQQALDAQAVAERTFIYYHMASGRKAAHPDADVCMDYRCCNAYTSAQAAADKRGVLAAEYDA